MKKNFPTKLYELIKSGCLIFTVIVFAFYILGNAVSSAVQVLTLTNLFLLFLFSIWFALSNTLLKTKKLNVILRVVLHFISTIIGFFVIFIYLPGNLENKARAFVLTLAFAAVYIVVAAIGLIIRKAIIKNKNNEEEYQSVYEKQKQD